MTRFPGRLEDRLAETIARTQRAVTRAHTRLDGAVSAVSALQPGQWQPLTLAGGWSNLTDYVPGQVRVHQVGLAHLTGHLTGGSCADGTVIGTLPPGFFNPVHMHAFNANAITGADASAQAGAVTNGAVSAGVVPAMPASDHTFTTQSFQVPATTFTVPAGAWTAGPNNWNFKSNGAGFSMGPTSGQQIGPIGINSQSLNSTATSTAVNMNTPTITVDTAGNMIITNVDPNVTALSFSELMPLVTD